MRALVVHAHPSPDSFSAALFREVSSALRAGGHSVIAIDLYTDHFDPVLPLEVYRRYLDASANRQGVEHYVDSLMTSQALVCVFPVWHDGPPAILKGFFDRVLVRGVAFDVVDGVFYPRLQNIGRLAAVTLYGADRERTKRVGDLPRRLFRHNLLTLFAPDAKFDYMAAHGMDHLGPEARAEFLAKIRRSFRTW